MQSLDGTHLLYDHVPFQSPILPKGTVTMTPTKVWPIDVARFRRRWIGVSPLNTFQWEIRYPNDTPQSVYILAHAILQQPDGSALLTLAVTEPDGVSGVYAVCPQPDTSVPHVLFNRPLIPPSARTTVFCGLTPAAPSTTTGSACHRLTPSTGGSASLPRTASPKPCTRCAYWPMTWSSKAAPPAPWSAPL